MAKKKIYFANLKRGIEVIFPKECAVCHEAVDQSQYVKFFNAPERGFFKSFSWTIGNREHIKVPAHKSCAKKIRTSTGKMVLYSILIGVGIIESGYIIEKYNINPHLFGMLILLVISLVYLIINRTVGIEERPIRVDFNLKNENENSFTFTNEKYAEEFAKLNNVKLERNEYE